MSDECWPCDVCGGPTSCKKTTLPAQAKGEHDSDVQLEVKVTVLCSYECAAARIEKLLALGD